MREKRHSTGTGRTFLGAAAIVVAGTLLFNGIAEGAMQGELDKTQQIPTTYQAAPLNVMEQAPPDGYQKANYTVVYDPLYRDGNMSTSKDLTMEEAAELGAQMLWETFDVDLEGATIYMGYDAGSESSPRASWSGDVRFGERTAPDGTPGLHGYYFTLDAVTGERFMTCWSRTLSENVPLGLDLSLAQNPGEYLDLARTIAEEQNLVHGEVKEVTYGGQGYGSNDPSISFNVVGVNGELASLDFSRYDQKLMGVGYDASCRMTNAYIEKMEREAEEKERAMQGQRSRGGKEGVLIAD